MNLHDQMQHELIDACPCCILEAIECEGCCRCSDCCDCWMECPVCHSRTMLNPAKFPDSDLEELACINCGEVP